MDGEEAGKLKPEGFKLQKKTIIITYSMTTGHFLFRKFLIQKHKLSAALKD